VVPDDDATADEGPDTRAHGAGRASFAGSVRRFRLTVVEGPSAGVTWESTGDRCSLGSHELNDLVLADPTVSRFHCEIRVSPQGARLKDLESTNGTIVDGVMVFDGLLRGGSSLRLGATVAQFTFGAERNSLEASPRTEFGGMVGTSFPMRATFAILERAAATEATVLIEGETGTGKGLAAESIHRAGARRDRPFLIVDCGAIPPTLLESELFGHERGAFTGAVERRIGAFEEASGGTIFLDEIGELPPEMQPKLLRALESREIRRVGSNSYRPVDIRLIAATNRDLRAEVNAGRFRPDLYFRLAVVKVTLPPLRQRPEDLPPLVDRFLQALGASEADAARLRTPELFAAIQRGAWPGNIRELRNYLERCLVFQRPLPMGDEAPGTGAPPVDVSVPYSRARRELLDRFERRYLEELMRAHGGKPTHAAQAAGIDRVHLYRLLRKHGLN
jgi:DNA-binding NtrC family response regulator